MNIWLAIALILGVVTLYQLTIQIFMISFKLTGMATSKIKFQVASLFTGAGFTTQESELIVHDEKRRKIAVACMYTGHVFSVVFMGLVVNVLFSFGVTISAESFEMPTFVEWYFIILYVSLFFFLLMLIIKTPLIHKHFIKMLESIAINSMKHNKKTNILTVFDMHGKFAIAEVMLNYVPEALVDIPLLEMGLTKKYSINVLSVKRGSRIFEATKDTMFVKGDALVIYGLIKDIKAVFIDSVNKNKDVIVIDRTNEVTLINNYGPNALVEVYVEEVPEELKNVKMQNAHLTDKYNITIGVIKRKDNYIYPNKDTVIKDGDTLTLFGSYKQVKMLFNNEDIKPIEDVKEE